MYEDTCGKFIGYMYTKRFADIKTLLLIEFLLVIKLWSLNKVYTEGRRKKIPKVHYFPRYISEIAILEICVLSGILNIFFLLLMLYDAFTFMFSLLLTT